MPLNLASGPGGYTVVDKRGQEVPPPLPCRVCGCKMPHSIYYDKPTMECIKHLRDEREAALVVLQKWYNWIATKQLHFTKEHLAEAAVLLKAHAFAHLDPQSLDLPE